MSLDIIAITATNQTPLVVWMHFRCPESPYERYSTTNRMCQRVLVEKCFSGKRLEESEEWHDDLIGLGKISNHLQEE